MSTSNYTVDIPDNAVIVDSWDALHAEARNYPWSRLDPKYGGNVIEVDGVIRLATTDKLTQQIEQKMASLPPHTEEQIVEQKRREKHLIEHHMPAEERERFEREDREKWEEGKPEELETLTPEKREEARVEKRACSHPRCFFDSTCRTYTDCHVCRGATGPGPHGQPASSGTCI